MSVDWMHDQWLKLRSGDGLMFAPLTKNSLKTYRQKPPAIRGLTRLPASSFGQEWMQWMVAAMNEQGMMSSGIALRVNVFAMMADQLRGVTLVADDGAAVVVPDYRIDKRRLPYFGGRHKPERIAADDDVVRDLLRFSRTQGVAGAVIAGMIFTGRRVEQMTSLERDQIQRMPSNHPVAAVIRWRADQTKTGDDADVTYLPRELLAYWPELEGEPGRMFPCSVDLVDKRLGLFSEAFDLDVKLTSHDLRRWFITKNHMRGVPLKLIGDMVGQKSMATTASYIKKQPNKVIAAAVAEFGADVDDGKNNPTKRWGNDYWWKA